MPTREILVIDNFDNSSPEAMKRIEEITGRKLTLLEADMAAPGDQARIIDAVKQFKADSAIHLAGLKAVGESVSPSRCAIMKRTCTRHSRC